MVDSDSQSRSFLEHSVALRVSWRHVPHAKFLPARGVGMSMVVLVLSRFEFTLLLLRSFVASYENILHASGADVQQRTDDANDKRRCIQAAS